MLLILMAAGIAYTSARLLSSYNNRWISRLLLLALFALSGLILARGIGKGNFRGANHNTIVWQQDIAELQRTTGIPLLITDLFAIASIGYFQVLNNTTQYYFVPDSIEDALATDDPQKLYSFVQFGQALRRQVKSIPSLDADQLVTRHRRILLLESSIETTLWLKHYPHTTKRVSVFLGDGKEVSAYEVIFTKRND